MSETYGVAKEAKAVSVRVLDDNGEESTQYILKKFIIRLLQLFFRTIKMVLNTFLKMLIQKKQHHH